MRRILSVLLVCSFSIVASAQTRGNVSLKGKLKNFSNQVEVEDMSDLQYLLPPTNERMILPDTSGNFSITFSVASPNYFRIGRNILYLSPGDNMEVIIDKNAPAKGSFKGRGSAANLYLRNTPFPKGGSFVEAGRNVKKIPQATIDTILQIASSRQKELDDVNDVPAEFKRLEYARIKADLINSLRAGQFSYRPRMSKDSLAAYVEEYAKIVQPLIEEKAKNFDDASLMKLVVYRDVADEVLKHPGKANDLQQIKDWMAASGLNDQMKKVSDKKQLKGFVTRIDSIKTKTYHDALDKDLRALLKFGKGDMAADFTAVDLNGNKVSLSSLKGKVIYVDLWATWCGPCLAEMPHYDSLKIKYKDNPNIVFVSLSIDDGIEPWKNNVMKRNADGYQWLINRNSLNDYNIVGIPRTLLIDRNFKIVNMDAPMPSAKELPAIIDNLVKL
jgi:thiol-disulfide isomerase/thioredoxin